MTASYLEGVDAHRVAGKGGSNRVTIPASPFQIRGGTGTGGATSVPCRGCKIICPTGSSNVRVRIDSACTTITGIAVPEHLLANGINGYLDLNISDLNQLYFLGEAQNDTVDILWWR